MIAVAFNGILPSDCQCTAGGCGCPVVAGHGTGSCVDTFLRDSAVRELAAASDTGLGLVFANSLDLGWQSNDKAIVA